MSASRLGTWMTCPLQAKFRYEDHEPREVNAKAAFGVAIHSALQLYNTTGDPDRAEKHFLDLWDNPEKMDNVPQYWPRNTSFGGLRKRGQEIIRDVHQRTAWDTRTVLGTEHPFLVPFGEHELTGFVDLLEIRRSGKGKDIIRVVDYKGLDLDTPTLTPMGWTKFGDLRVGDEVVGSSGRPTVVEGIFPLGIVPSYRISFSDGASVVCSEDHLWHVIDLYGIHRTLPVEKFSSLRKRQNHRYFIPTVAPVQFAPAAPLPIDPYVLGVLLADGCITQTIAVSNVDAEVRARFEKQMPAGLRLVDRDTVTWGVSKTGDRNPITDALRRLCLMGLQSHEKFIPDIYLRASIAERVELLRGLMDCDGCSSTRTDYRTSSPRLRDDLIELCRSLGGVPTTCTVPGYYLVDGVRHNARDCHIVFPRVPFNPFHLVRKAASWRSPTQRQNRAITAIERVSDREMQCIKVAATDGLHVVDGYVVTHNTSSYAPNMAALSLNVQFTVYIYASHTREFWFGNGPDFPPVENVEWVYEMYEGLPRRAIWYDLWRQKELDAGPREESDFLRLYRVADQIAKASELGVFVPKIGEHCQLCLSGDTEVVTSEGVRNIAELVDTRPTLLTIHGRGNGTWVEAPVRSYGQALLWRVVLRRGRVQKEVYATEDHRWPVRRATHGEAQFSTTRDLREGMYLRSCYGPGRARVRPSAFGIAHGITFGDGNRHRRGSEVTLHGEKDVQLLKWFPHSPTLTVSLGEGYKDEFATRVVDLPGFFKDVPCLDESKSYLYGWLAGYFAADGHITMVGQATLSSCRRENLEFVRDLCWVIGVGTHPITTFLRRGKGSDETPLYRIGLMTSTLTEDFFLTAGHRCRFRSVVTPPWRVVRVEPTDRIEEVFCPTVEESHVFVLGDGVVTGNCDYQAPCGMEIPTAEQLRDQDNAWI